MVVKQLVRGQVLPLQAMDGGRRRGARSQDVQFRAGAYSGKERNGQEFAGAADGVGGDRQQYAVTNTRIGPNILSESTECTGHD